MTALNTCHVACLIGIELFSIRILSGLTSTHDLYVVWGVGMNSDLCAVQIHLLGCNRTFLTPRRVLSLDYVVYTFSIFP